MAASGFSFGSSAAFSPRPTNNGEATVLGCIADQPNTGCSPKGNWQMGQNVSSKFLVLNASNVSNAKKTVCDQ